MLFQPGNPGGPGRPPGARNKKRLPKVSDYLAEKNVNVIDELLKMLRKATIEDKDKINILRDLLSYCYAKPKEVDVSEWDDDELLIEKFASVSDEALLKLVNE